MTDTTKTPAYDTLTDDILSRVGPELDATAFARLALACLDQAGIPEHVESKIRALLNPCFSVDL